METQSKQNKVNTGRWNKKQHKLFLQGLKKYGKDWKLIQLQIPNRSLTQVRSHAQKYFIKRQKLQYDSCQSSNEDQEFNIINNNLQQYQDQEKEIDITRMDNFIKTDHFIEQKSQMKPQDQRINKSQQVLNINSNANIKQHNLQMNHKFQFLPLLQDYTIYNSFYHSMLLNYYDIIMSGKYLQLVDLPNDQKTAKISNIKI